MNTLCIYHGKCADGFSAAWAVKQYFYNEAMKIDFYPGKYGEEPPDVTGQDVIIVDFSYPRETMIEMSKQAQSILVLDHHKTAEEALMDLEPEMECPSRIIFDMDRSGCRLAWDYFHTGKEAPAALLAVEDRDLWRFNEPYTKEISAFIGSLEQTFENWDYIMNNDNLGEIIDSGSALLRKHDKDVDSLLNIVNFRWIEIGEVPVVNTPWMFASELGNKLCLKYPDAKFSATYYMDSDGKYKFSLRSTDDQHDVSIIAKEFGGGGHRNAAGFTCSVLPWE